MRRVMTTPILKGEPPAHVGLCVASHHYPDAGRRNLRSWVLSQIAAGVEPRSRVAVRAKKPQSGVICKVIYKADHRCWRVRFAPRAWYNSVREFLSVRGRAKQKRIGFVGFSLLLRSDPMYHPRSKRTLVTDPPEMASNMLGRVVAGSVFGNLERSVDSSQNQYVDDRCPGRIQWIRSRLTRIGR